EVDNEVWIVSEEAAEKLDHQDRNVRVNERMEGSELVGETVKNPVTGDRVLMLPATFVDPEAGSGIVMSVPAHAPYDWISLKDIKEDEDLLEKYGLSEDKVRSIEPVSIIETEKYGRYPAKEACEEYDVKSQEDEDKLERATEDVYNREFHTGVMKSNCGEFAGQSVEEVKSKLEEKFTEDGKFDHIWDFSEPVVCRCGGRVVVAETESWFLKYGEKSWKDKALRCLNQMETVPEETRNQYSHTIDWLENWPCIRNYGLGTKLPFDERFIVEPLSDSTIYMAFYTISHMVQDIDPEKLKPVFFDYVFLGEGSPGKVEERTGINKDRVKELRRSFNYWYPLDWRSSADELVENHLTFFILHHSALFPEDKWPGGIAAWGMGTLEGKAMSSSKGHVVLANEAIERYGADTTRFFLFVSSEPWQSFDWQSEKVESYRDKVGKFYRKVKELQGLQGRNDENTSDRYLMSKMNSIVKEVTQGLEDFQTRKAGMQAFFEMEDALDWYLNMNDQVNTGVLNRFLRTWVKLMAPFTPHTCEELWEEIGGEGFVST
ncbi:MAG: leucine--tRNA ligase, partial [Candidatus Aenigmatarchaeota archaeon]